MYRRESRSRQPDLSGLKMSKEFIMPPDATLFFGHDDLIADPVKNPVILPPNATYTFSTTLDAYWSNAFSAIQNGQGYGGIHLRSGLAQSQADISWWFPEPENTSLISVKLQNLSPHTATLEEGVRFKIGQPYFFRTPMQGQQLENFVNEIGYLSDKNASKPRVLRKPEKEKYALNSGIKLPISNEFDALEIPLVVALDNNQLHGNIELDNLPSGPDREALHKVLRINNEGFELKSTPQTTRYAPKIQLTGTPIFKMPNSTALVVEYGIKNIPGIPPFFVEHSSSRVHNPVAVTSGTANTEGQLYRHRFVIETYNQDRYYDHYPSEVVCKAFKVQIVD